MLSGLTAFQFFILFNVFLTPSLLLLAPLELHLPLCDLFVIQHVFKVLLSSSITCTDLPLAPLCST